MGVKQGSVAMPMSSAGMIGFSPDVAIEGREIEPKMLIMGTVAFVVIVLVASHVMAL
jgi:preprotein translocase subunit Sec61beta